MKLIKPGPWPPGGFPYTDPRTGYHFGQMDVDAVGQARRIIAHRLANPDVYPQHESVHFSLSAVTQQVLDSVCAKHPSVCMDEVPPAPPGPEYLAAPQKSPARETACPRCGTTDWFEVYCPTCSGKRVIALQCRKCGAQKNP